MSKIKEITIDDLQESSKIKILSQVSILDLDPEIKIKDYDFIYIPYSWNMSKIIHNKITHHQGMHSNSTIKDIKQIIGDK